MKNKVYFRADAGQSIGYGHFIRSLALADMLKDDFDCTFFTQSPTEYQLREAAEVCPVVALPYDDSRFAQFLDLLQGDEIVVLDNYFYTSEYQKQIKEKGCKLVCIDDVHDRRFYADVIINHCVISCDGYSAEKETRFFLGARWALLRAPFLKALSETHEENHWVITFGGSDPYNLTLAYVNHLRSLVPDAKISLMLGDGYQHFEDLKDIPNITIYRKLSAPQVADLFRSAANVICSASSVCYEALSCGCNVYAGVYVDNQEDFYSSLSEQKLIVPLGDLRKATINVALNRKTPCSINITDIADRYRRVFRALSLTVVNYSDMTLEQIRKTWECRNRADIRQWMTNPEPFSFESHQGFVSSLKEKPSKLYYSFFNKDEFIGSYDYVGIEDGNVAERGLFVNPDYQGRQVATMMENYLDGEIIKRGVHRLVAEVLKVNDRSYKYHLKVGYKVYKEDEKYFYLERYI